MGSCFRPERTDARTGKRVKYRKYRITWTDEHGDRQSRMAFRDKQASEALLAKIERDVERKRAGLRVVEESHRLKPVADLVEEFTRELVSRGSDPAGPHIKEARRILSRVCEGCGWKRLGDVRRDAFADYLANMAQAGKAPLTRKQHLAFTRNLLNWCVDQGWLAESPIEGIEAPAVGHAGRRRRRRAYTNDELQRLLAATPEPRRTLYLIAALSGYRRKELRLMERQDLTPDGDRPRWHLRAVVSKNRRCDIVPIVPDLQPILAPIWSRLRSASSRLVGDGLGIAVPRHETLHADLTRAKIERVTEDGRHADFHSFRYTFCRIMGEVLPIQKVKVLMRHSTIKLTADLYGELGIDDLGEDVWSLPPLRAFEGNSGAPTGAHMGRSGEGKGG